MTDSNASLHVFRRPEDVPVMPEPKTDFISKIFVKGRTGLGYPWFGGLFFLSCSAVRHYSLGIPPFAKIYYHIGAFTLGYWFGGLADNVTTKVYAERDAMMAHYISLHPEDFVEEPAPKLKYVLYPWVPNREHWSPLKNYPLK